MYGDASCVESFCLGLDPEAVIDSVCPIICPPAPYLFAMKQLLPAGYHVGGQTCSPFEDVAHTGQISATMLADAGASYVIIGHAEQRALQSPDPISGQMHQAVKAGLTPILCVGETHPDVVEEELRQQLNLGWPHAPVLLAYEPVWAIGAASPPGADHINKVFSFLKSQLKGTVSYLYGGAVDGQTLPILLKQVPLLDGFLVGRASRDAVQFNQLLKTLR